MTRLHEPTLELLVRRPTDLLLLVSPAPGWFHPLVQASWWLSPGQRVGTLAVLGRLITLVVPARTSGAVTNVLGSLEPRAVAFGETLLGLDDQTLGTAATATAAPAAAEAGRVFRAPTSGRFYGRSSPDKPAFVSAGDLLQQGATICLLEVMKTFHRVTYSGEPATVKALLVADGADVNQGDALLALE